MGVWNSVELQPPAFMKQLLSLSLSMHTPHSSANWRSALYIKVVLTYMGLSMEGSLSAVHAAFSARAQDNYRWLLAQKKDGKERRAMVEAQNQLLRPPAPSVQLTEDQLFELGRKEFNRRCVISKAKAQGRAPPAETPIDAATAELRLTAYRTYERVKKARYMSQLDPTILAEQLAQRSKQQKLSRQNWTPERRALDLEKSRQYYVENREEISEGLKHSRELKRQERDAARGQYENSEEQLLSDAEAIRLEEEESSNMRGRLSKQGTTDAQLQDLGSTTERPGFFAQYFPEKGED